MSAPETTLPPVGPQQLAEQTALLTRISQRWQQLAQIYAQGGSDFAQDAARLAAISARCFQEAWKFWQARGGWTMPAMASATPPADKRFKHEGWQEGWFAIMRDTYLQYAEQMRAALQPQTTQEAQDTEALRFFSRQLISAFAPSNFAFSNPEVWAEAQATQGLSLLRGVANYLDDLVRGNGRLSIRMTDLDAFEPGRNVACTAGAVVFQNRLIQLLQYTPSTDTVYKRPLMIVPPWINKFYILDLRAQNSFIKWAVDQGHTVFVLSWVNPGEAHRDVSFDDYVQEGIFAALDEITRRCDSPDVNAVGYCLGGTLLATSLAVMAKRGDKRIAKATYLATLIDFSEPGEIGVYIDDQQLDLLEAQMLKEGVFSGRNMATAFNSLRENDLIWSYWVNNYLLGKEPMAFDLLYWNCDATNLPAKMHAFYLRNMYRHNRLAQPGALNVLGTPVDIRLIETPVYFLSTEQDHIALWTGTYKGAQLHGGEVRFVLGGSGHIAGVINPEGSTKYGYRVNSSLPDSAEDWLASSTAHQGSWWPDWQKWVSKDAGKKIAARLISEPLEAAPGSYVKVKI